MEKAFTSGSFIHGSSKPSPEFVDFLHSEDYHEFGLHADVETILSDY